MYRLAEVRTNGKLIYSRRRFYAFNKWLFYSVRIYVLNTKYICFIKARHSPTPFKETFSIFEADTYSGALEKLKDYFDKTIYVKDFSNDKRCVIGFCQEDNTYVFIGVKLVGSRHIQMTPIGTTRTVNIIHCVLNYIFNSL